MENLFLCAFEGPKYLFFSSNVPVLVYYSHGLSLLLSLFLGFFIIASNRKALTNRILLFVVLSFSAWVVLDLIFWASNRNDVIMTVWAMILLIEPLVYVGSLLLTYKLVGGKDLSLTGKLVVFFLYLPLIFLVPTNLGLSGFDLESCLSIEGPIALYYTYAVEIFLTLWIIIFGTKKYWLKENIGRKKEIFLIITGVFLLLVSFASGNIIGSFTENWNLAQIGFFGVPIFIGLLVYSIVRFQTFNIKLIATQALVIGLTILIGAQFFFIKAPASFVLNGFTFIAVLVFGYLLTKTVKKEVLQKEELFKINNQLKSLIQQRESLVHLITHKVKGSFTRTKYIFAEMLNDTFGILAPEMKKMAQTGLESDDTGIKTIDMVLNASNLESGIVKYDMKKIDLKEIVLSAVAEKKVSADFKQLKIETKMNDERYDILGDAFWLKEVANNLIDNSIKYTNKEGEITVGIERHESKVLFYVKDNGIGITAEDMVHLFTEGGRGKESVKMNVDSTGYGLYSVKLIMDAHGGRVWAESEGRAQGAQFFVELPSA